MPISITDGWELSRHFDLTKLAGNNTQMLAMTTSTSQASNAIAIEQIHCTLDLNFQAKSPIINVTDLGKLNEFHLEISNTNELRTVVGQIRFPVTALPQGFIWPEGGAIQQLQTEGSTWVEAKGVNNENAVVGSSLNSSNQWIATLWLPDEQAQLLGTLDGNNSYAIAINDARLVVGNVSISPMPSDGEFHHAFFWTNLKGMQYIHEPGSERTTAIGVNNRNEVLYWRSINGIQQTCIWSEATGSHSILNEYGRTFYGTAINDNGVVLGSTRDSKGIHHCAIWSMANGFSILNTPPSFHATSIDKHGNVVGFDECSPWIGAWLITVDGRQIPLLTGLKHNIYAQCIAGDAIFGHARLPDSWKHSHPLRRDIQSSTIA